jgi:hypothetical protein
MDDGAPAAIVCDDYQLGNFKSFLRSNRQSPVNAARKIAMSLDVARGLGFLAGRHVVLGDVGTRICTVGRNLQVVVGCLEEPTIAFPDDYRQVKGAKGRGKPVRITCFNVFSSFVFAPFFLPFVSCLGNCTYWPSRCGCRDNAQYSWISVAIVWFGRVSNKQTNTRAQP